MNPEQWLSLKWNGGSTMSDRWLNQSKIIQETCTGYIEEKDGRMTTCDLIVSLEQLDMIIPGEKYILQNKFEVEIGKIKEVNHEEQTATIMVFIREKVLTNLQRYIKKLDGFQLL